MKKKVYYRYVFQLKSAMNVGSGNNDATDKDILKNRLGTPYIPGSTMAGVFRSLFSEEEAKKYFGYVEIAGKDVEAKYGTAERPLICDSSKTITYDGIMLSDKFEISKRDCVGLDDYKTAIDGTKFDFEILEPGVRFLTYLEQDLENGEEEVGKTVARAWEQGRVLFGSKTQRGYGETILIDVRKAEFYWDKEGIEKWLDFNMYDSDISKWTVVKSEKNESGKNEFKTQIILKLKQEGGISIRKYTTAFSDSKDALNPDYEQLHYIDDEDKKKEKPVIPGTTWAGAFLHQMKKLTDGNIEKDFGLIKTENGKAEFRRSKIRFSESIIENAVSKVIVRNALDRFTNATIDGALYTERTFYGGTTELVITFEKDLSAVFKQTLAKAILDLNYGFLSVGGLTSIGRGIFSIQEMSVDGNNVELHKDAEKIFSDICEIMEGKHAI